MTLLQIHSDGAQKYNPAGRTHTIGASANESYADNATMPLWPRTHFTDHTLTQFSRFTIYQTNKSTRSKLKRAAPSFQPTPTYAPALDVNASIQDDQTKSTQPNPSKLTAPII